MTRCGLQFWEGEKMIRCGQELEDGEIAQCQECENADFYDLVERMRADDEFPNNPCGD